MEDVNTADVGNGFQRSTHTVNTAGPWLFWGTALICLVVLGTALPVLLLASPRRKQQADEVSSTTDETKNENETPAQTTPKTAALLRAIFQYDRETKRLLRLMIPYTLEMVATNVFSIAVLILIAQTITEGNGGSHHVAAYAIVHMLVEITDGLLLGPAHICPTLCSQAVGADNYYLGGQYTQIALSLYLLLNIPVLWFWYNYMHDTILYLQWGDEVTATLAQDYVRSYMGCIIFSGITDTISQLWVVEDYATALSTLEIVDGAVTVAVIAMFLPYYQSLEVVGWVCSVIALISLIIMLAVSHYKKYVTPFYHGLFDGFALRNNVPAMKDLLSATAVISIGEVAEEVEWAFLAYLASFMGPAEVAAWAILGNLWELFHSLYDAIGEAAELRISLHLGNNNPILAELAMYKSLMMGLCLSIIVSVVFIALKTVIPTWLTQDPTLQQLLEELIPLMAIANVAIAFGMHLAYVLGAQLKFALEVGISVLCDWAICVPIAALFVLICHLDLKVLAAAIALGYILAGACFTWVIATTEWAALALEIYLDNEESSSSSDEESVVSKEKTFNLVAETCDSTDTQESELSKELAKESTPLVAKAGQSNNAGTYSS